MNGHSALRARCTLIKRTAIKHCVLNSANRVAVSATVWKIGSVVIVYAGLNSYTLCLLYVRVYVLCVTFIFCVVVPVLCHFLLVLYKYLLCMYWRQLYALVLS